ncbi:L,D-transpeptidase family protein [Sphingomonas tabacisoli]|uniref:L,D-transpeptidase family protein n=1 Tax=Sphingomonas tabacisoli TaxID=2249466 RepID=A0ABW4I2F9_9SPHN
MKQILAVAALAASATVFAQGASPAGIDLTVMQAQVALDKAGFSPGVIDGKSGASLRRALSGFQKARGLSVSGKIDDATLKALGAGDPASAVTTVQIAPEDIAGPFTNPIPKEPADQAKLQCLCYRTPLEKLAEHYHTTPATLMALNSPDTPLKAGQSIKVPAVVPGSRDYAGVKDEGWRRTLADLGVNAQQPQGDKVVVDKSDGVLRVFSGDKVVAQFPVTMGSQHDPLPIGSWKIKGFSYNPKFHYNPDLFWDAKPGDEKATLPAGPNGPVGVIWMDLSKEHYGIHGTPEPQTIGRTESHGCIRMTNWDAARLSLIVKPGTPAIFQE